MDPLTYKQAVLACLQDDPRHWDRQVLARQLEAEMAKPVEEMDCDYIAALVDALARLDGIAIDEPVPAPPPLPHSMGISRPRRKRWRTALLIAAIVLLSAVAALAVSAEVFHFSIVHYVATIFSDHVTVDYAKQQSAASYQLALSGVRKELADNGIQPVLLPDKYIQQYGVERIDYYPTGGSAGATLHLQMGRNYADINIWQYNQDYLLGESDHQGTLKESREVSVNGISILVLDFGTRRSVSYVEGLTQYIINTDLPMDEAVQLAGSIQ